MFLKFPFWVTLGFNVIGWPLIQMGLAWFFTRMPAHWFQSPPPFPGESPRLYEALGIKQWKGRLPDAATWFAGGFAKKGLTRRDPDYLKRFSQETWRGELCHWAALGLTPLFFLWNPLWADAVMVLYALLANLPCILTQRYNRLRMDRLTQGRGSER